MIPLIILLANSAAADGEMIPLTVVIALITAIVGGVGGNHLGKKSKMTIEPNPLNVNVTDQFVSRREFDEFRGLVGTNFAEVKGLIQRSNDNVERKHFQLLETIEAAAKNGVNGRVALWDEVKENGKDIAALTSRVDIAGGLEKLLKEMQTRERKAADALKKGGSSAQG